MKLLTQQQAQELINKAWEMVHKYSLGQYRFGQALMNLLPDDIHEIIYMTENDFFYWQDSDKVMEVFYKYCVEEN